MIQLLQRPSVMVSRSRLAEVRGQVSLHLARHDHQAAGAAAGLVRDDHREVIRAVKTARGSNKVGDQGL